MEEEDVKYVIEALNFSLEKCKPENENLISDHYNMICNSINILEGLLKNKSQCPTAKEIGFNELPPKH